MKKFLLSLAILATAAGLFAQKAIHSATALADAQMRRKPQMGDSEIGKGSRWNYTQGVLSKSFVELWHYTKEDKYLQYVKDYIDEFIHDDGTVTIQVSSKGKKSMYDPKAYDFDKVNCPFLFEMMDDDPKVKKAIAHIATTYEDAPRTKEGAFWHKGMYPYQNWLDGIYMQLPFWARYAIVFDKPAIFDDIINQVVIVHNRTWDPATELNHHAYDETKERTWANKETGLSANFWGRGIGWYSMALIDLLDYIPEDHPRRNEMVKILRQVSQGVVKHQDKSGAWWQVVDMPGREGNYLEASASSMFVYTLLKGVRKGFLEKKFLDPAKRGLVAMNKEFIVKDENGLPSLSKICQAAGVSDPPRKRDGSFEYYISEPVVNDDPKGVGPYIMAFTEAEKLGIKVPKAKQFRNASI